MTSPLPVRRCSIIRVGLAAALALFLWVGVSDTQAADTVETWDVGATDVDYYMGIGGLGLPRQDGGVFGDLLLGYGLAERFSGYVGIALTADRNLGQSDPEHYLGLFGTPVETDHFDLDIFLNFAGSATGYAIAPSVELNLDRDPDMSSYGLFLRSGPVFSNLPADPEVEGSEDRIGTTWRFTPGVYWSVSPRSQLFFQYSNGYVASPEEGQDNWDVGQMQVGYNIFLTEAIELITEINWDAKKTDGVTPWGGFVGIIVTLPTAGGEG